MPLAGKNTHRRSIAILGALCFLLSAIEYLIPKPLPFLRLGLANLPLMLAIDILPFGSFLVLLALKTAGQALTGGTLFSYVALFSAASTLASGLSMYGLRRLAGKKHIGFVGVALTGALFSNLAQLFLAGLLVFGPSARYIAPPLLAAGLISGVALGLFTEAFTRQSSWYRSLSNAH